MRLFRKRATAQNAADAQVQWWRRSGLAAAASSGRRELDDRGMNAMIFESPREGVTVIVARDHRAAALRLAWAQVFRGAQEPEAPSTAAKDESGVAVPDTEKGAEQVAQSAENADVRGGKQR